MSARTHLGGALLALGAIAAALVPARFARPTAETPAASSRVQGTAASELEPAVAHVLDRAVWDEMERQELVGLAVGVVRDGRVVYTRGYGFADRERCEPVSERTLFRWASLSKPLTAVAALQLWDAGRLDLDADVREYVPEFPDKGEPITLRHLLSHQGGLSGTYRGPLARWSREWPHPSDEPVRALEVFRDTPLVGPPGAQFCYSTPGYILLSAAVQRAGGEPFIAQVRERIAEPLGLASLQPDRGGRHLPYRAAGYRRLRGRVVRVCRAPDVSWKLGGGGFTSNIGDLARFAAALLDGTLVSKDAESLMWTPRRDASGRRTKYGLGFKIDRDTHGRPVVWHDGAQEKTRSRLVLYPDQGFGIVLLSNCEHADLDRFATAIEKALGFRGELLARAE
jgi:serine beta-lactamase-like protein LACTB